MGFKFDGLSDLKEALQRLKDGSGGAIDEALMSHMTDVVYPETEARVPVLTGLLKATGRVEKTPGEEHAVSIWYGDSEVQNTSPGVVDYAAAVHERDARHAPPTQYKFVEEPLKESLPQLENKIADRLEELLE